MISRLYGGLTLAVGLGLAVLGPGSVTTPAPSHTASTSGALDGRVAYPDFDSGVIDTVNPDGTAIVQVTDPNRDGFAFAPAWTPNGRWILYVANKNGSDNRIHAIRPDGTDGHLLMRDKPGWQDFVPRVSPDGHTVFFLRCRPDPPGGCAIARVDLNGTHFTQITSYHARVDQGEGNPVPSPDGRHLAYNEFGRRGIAVQVWVSRLDGSHARPLTPPAMEAAAWTWTPDGRALLGMDNWEHLAESIFRIPLHGTSVRLLHPPSPHQDYTPYASPSGRYMTFLSDVDFPDLSGQHIYIANIDGSDPHLLDVGSDNVGVAAWGTAPLLPESASTPVSRRAPAMTAGERRQAWSLVPSAYRPPTHPAIREK